MPRLIVAAFFLDSAKAIQRSANADIERVIITEDRIEAERLGLKNIEQSRQLAGELPAAARACRYRRRARPGSAHWVTASR